MPVDLPWVPVGFLGIQWNPETSRESYGMNWKPLEIMEPYGILWTPMEFCLEQVNLKRLSAQPDPD